jgi:hypothetical protein
MTVNRDFGYRSTATVTRAANTTPYTANDVYGGAFELPNIATDGGSFILNQVRFIFNISAVPSGFNAFRLYLFNISPPSAVADNGAFSLPAGDRASCLTPDGLSGNASLAVGGGSVVMNISDINRIYRLADGSTSLYLYLVTLGGFTPAAPSESFTVVANVLGV